MTHPHDHPLVGHFDSWHAYERVRAWAEDTWCGSHPHRRGPAGLAGAILGFLDEHPHYNVYADAFITIEAIRSYYGTNRLWWESAYIERMHDAACQKVERRPAGVDPEDWTPAIRLATDDVRRQWAPWWRAALIVDRLHTTVMCGAVSMLNAQSCSTRGRGLRSVSMPITPLTVESILSSTWGYGRGGWPGAYRDFPEDADLEREGKLPRLLLGEGPQGLGFDMGLWTQSDRLSFPSEAALALEADADGFLRFSPEDDLAAAAERHDERW